MDIDRLGHWAAKDQECRNDHYKYYRGISNRCHVPFVMKRASALWLAQRSRQLPTNGLFNTGFEYDLITIENINKAIFAGGG
jgi:hypothetical protein